MPQVQTNTSRNGQQLTSYVPPQNIEAELATLASMLIEPAAVETAVGMLTSDDFYRKEHRILFDVILTLAGRNQPTDTITVPAELKRWNQLEFVGGIAFITALFDTVASAANIEYHAKIVKTKSLLRQQVELGFRIAALATAADADPDQVQRQADLGLRAIEQPSEDASFVTGPVWPKPDDAMFYGLAGDIVRAIDPHTEADPMAVLMQFLVAFGSCIGRGAYYQAEADRHYGNLFGVLVGLSAKARKGTSWGQVGRVFEKADPEWATSRVKSGMSTGEGLIHAVRDPLKKEKKNKKTGEMELVEEEEGVEDKRLLVHETEFVSVLRQTQRDGNTLSATIRNAWDTGRLQSMTKNSPAQATGAHISIVGHITQNELLKELAQAETDNGFGNRYLWVCARRSKELPEGGRIDTVNFAPMISKLHSAIDKARPEQRIEKDDAARAIWRGVYSAISAGGPGLSGSVTSRAEAQIVRLAMLYALLDEANIIRQEHMLAALAFWQYVLASARFIFGDALGNRVADTILQRLRQNPRGLTRTQISNELGRNMNRAKLDEALALLSQHGFVCSDKQSTGGAPVEIYKAVSTK